MLERSHNRIQVKKVILESNSASRDVFSEEY